MSKKKATPYPLPESELVTLIAKLTAIVQRQDKQLKLITELLWSMREVLPKQSRDALAQIRREKKRHGSQESNP